MALARRDGLNLQRSMMLLPCTSEASKFSIRRACGVIDALHDILDLAPRTACQRQVRHLEEDFDEDLEAEVGVVLGDAHAGQHCPGDGVRDQQVRKKPRHITQLVGLQAMYERVLPRKALLVELLPFDVVPAVALRQQAIVPAKATHMALLNPHHALGEHAEDNLGLKHLTTDILFSCPTCNLSQSLNLQRVLGKTQALFQRRICPQETSLKNVPLNEMQASLDSWLEFKGYLR